MSQMRSSKNRNLFNNYVTEEEKQEQRKTVLRYFSTFYKYKLFIRPRCCTCGEGMGLHSDSGF